MAIRRPTHDQLAEMAERLGMTMSSDEVAFYLENMQPSLGAYDLIDALPDEIPAVTYPRTTGYRPGPEENPYNAWYWKCDVPGAAEGPLKGKTVALKDNVMLAGVPMMNGSVHPRRLRARCRRHHRRAPARRRRDDQGQGDLRAFLPLGRLAHLRPRAGEEPAQAGIRRAVRPRARARCWPRARSIWPSAAIRAARSACPRPIAAPTA
jgi:hypothetical protein